MATVHGQFTIRIEYLYVSQIESRQIESMTLNTIFSVPLVYLYVFNVCITLFKSIIMFSRTDNILYSIPIFDLNIGDILLNIPFTWLNNEIQWL